VQLMSKFAAVSGAVHADSSLCSCLVSSTLTATACLVSCAAHAAGTFIAGMLARHHRKRVHTLCLMDPVCFGM
jgi:hypothetical protein